MERKVEKRIFSHWPEKKEKIRGVIIGSGLAGTVNSLKMVIAIGLSVIKVNEPKVLKKFGGSFELTESWAQNLLANMDWVKRKGTTGEVQFCAKFLRDEKFSFQRAISKCVSENDIPLDLVFNLDQISLSYISPGKYTFDLKS